jgi:hypothetical protein
MSASGARSASLRSADAARLPTYAYPTTCRRRMALLEALTDTAVAVLPVARTLDRHGLPPESALVRTRRRPCRLGTDAYAAERCFTQQAKESAVRRGIWARFGCRARCRREAAPLLSRGWDPGPEVWRRVRRLLLRRGEQAPAVSGTKSSSCLCGGSRQPVNPLLSPVRQRAETRARHQEGKCSSDPVGFLRVPAALRVLAAGPGSSTGRPSKEASREDPCPT